MSFCENEIHNNEEKELVFYKKLNNGKLLICEDCGTLYYTYGGFMIRLREESFLISNIDSPMNNSIIGDCGHRMYKASDNIIDNASGLYKAWYYCLECNEMHYKDIPTRT